MPRRRMLTAIERQQLLAIPDNTDELIRYYTFNEGDRRACGARPQTVARRASKILNSLFGAYSCIRPNTLRILMLRIGRRSQSVPDLPDHLEIIVATIYQMYTCELARVFPRIPRQPQILATKLFL